MLWRCVCAAFIMTAQEIYIKKLLYLISILPAPVSLTEPSQINSSAKPGTRVDGSSLVNSDRWYNTAKNISYFWNGTLWLSLTQYHLTATVSFAAGTTSVNTAERIPLISATAQNSFFLETLTRNVALTGSDNTNYWALQAQTLLVNGAPVDVVGAAPVNLQNGANNSGSQTLNVIVQNSSSILQSIGFTALLTKFGAAPNLINAVFTFSGRIIAP